ncbi:hypothetical protein IJT17_01340 [bacterium]|nr:hypothetical protein [bacterium]
MKRINGLNGWAFSLAMVAIAGLAINLSGCEQKKLVTASIDTTKLLQNDDEYQRLAQQYFNERIKLASELQQDVKKSGGVIKDQSLYNKYAKAEADLNAEWLKKTREFTEKKMVNVRKICDKLHATKGIDLVVLDSDQQPTVEFGAVDVTADVLAELSGFASEPDTAKPADELPEKQDGGGDKTTSEELPSASDKK